MNSGGDVSNNAIVSSLNSTTAVLSGGATFTGTFEEILEYANITIMLKPSHASGTLGFSIQWSSDGTNIDSSDDFTVAAGAGKQYSFGVMGRYFRVKYVNGATLQTSFRLQTIMHPIGGKPSSHRIADAIVDDDDAELVKAVISGKDPNGTYQTVRVDSDGALVASPPNFVYNGTFCFGDVALTVLGTNSAIRRTAYTEQTTNAQRSIGSSSALDTAAGTGARTVKITYFDATGAGPFTETVTLNGITSVNTVSSTICFIEKMEITTVGATGANAGTITLHAAAAGLGVTIGTIAVGDLQTFWAHHYVAINKTCEITAFSVGHTGTTVGSGARFFMRSFPIGVSNAVEVVVSDFVRLYGQSSTITRNYGSPIEVLGPARIIAYANAETGTLTTYIASFDFFEV